MKDFYKSDYAINKKDEKAIIYRFADGTEKYINVDDFGGDMEAFRKWKELSDKDYLACDRHTYNTTRLNVSIEGIDETTLCSLPSVEEMLDEQVINDNAYFETKAFWNLLTEEQKRRLYCLAFRNMSVVKIAKSEGVSERAIRYTFTKIKKIFEKYVETISENGKKITIGERLRCYESYFKKATEDLENRKKKKFSSE